MLCACFIYDVHVRCALHGYGCVRCACACSARAYKMCTSAVCGLYIDKQCFIIRFRFVLWNYTLQMFVLCVSKDVLDNEHEEYICEHGMGNC